MTQFLAGNYFYLMQKSEKSSVPDRRTGSNFFRPTDKVWSLRSRMFTPHSSHYDNDDKQSKVELRLTSKLTKQGRCDNDTIMSNLCHTPDQRSPSRIASHRSAPRLGIRMDDSTGTYRQKTNIRNCCIDITKEIIKREQLKGVMT